jgi:hypothetical protein
MSLTSAGSTLSFSAKSSELGELAGNARGCPSTLSNEFECTHSFGAGVSDTTLELLATDSTGRTAAKEIELAPYNACGRDIAYVVVRATENGPAFDAPQLISPCEG